MHYIYQGRSVGFLADSLRRGRSRLGGGASLAWGLPFAQPRSRLLPGSGDLPATANSLPIRSLGPFAKHRGRSEINEDSHYDHRLAYALQYNNHPYAPRRMLHKHAILYLKPGWLGHLLRRLSQVLSNFIDVLQGRDLHRRRDLRQGRHDPPLGPLLQHVRSRVDVSRRVPLYGRDDPDGVTPAVDNLLPDTVRGPYLFCRAPVLYLGLGYFETTNGGLPGRWIRSGLAYSLATRIQPRSKKFTALTNGLTRTQPR